MNKRRVVVTGMGAVTAIGIGVDAFWDGVVNGKNGVKPITLIDTERHAVKFAGEITEFDPLKTIDKREAKRMDRFTQFAVVASEEALANSGLIITEENASRVGTIIGVGVGGLQTWEDQYIRFQNGGPDRVSPLLIPMMIPNMAAGHVSIRTGARGPQHSHGVGLHLVGARVGRGLRVHRQRPSRRDDRGRQRGADFQPGRGWLCQHARFIAAQ